jgi:hypothetical protein
MIVAAPHNFCKGGSFKLRSGTRGERFHTASSKKPRIGKTIVLPDYRIRALLESNQETIIFSNRLGAAAKLRADFPRVLEFSNLPTDGYGNLSPTAVPA